MQMKRVLSVVLAAVLVFALAVTQVDSAQAASTAYVVGGWLRMRSGPSFDYPTIASYNTGTAVTVLGTSGLWYYCQAPDGKTGYMYSSYLSYNAPSPTPVTKTKGWVYAANGRDVRLRSGPGLTYAVIGTYSVGHSLTILSRGDYWDYISIGKQKGYMMAQYITEQGGGTTPVTPPPSSGGYTAYVYASNGKRVHFRSGPGKSYSSLGLVNLGTQVTVLSHGATWDYIQIGTTTGYMMNSYLTTTPPHVVPPTPTTVTGVSLSNTSPTVGQTLSAVVQPAGATVSCRWYNNYGTLLSNTGTYTVKNTDVGYSIMVTVTGTGSTTGSASSPYSAQVTYSGPVTTALTSVSVSQQNPMAGQTLSASVQPSGATANYTWYRSDGVVVSGNVNYTVQNSDVGYRLFVIATGTGSYTGSVSSPYTNTVSGASTQALSGSVTLPNATVPGVTLTPAMILNTNQLTYNWQQNGVTVGTGSTLYVTEAMAGSDIRLTVTAVLGSGYEGQVSSNYCLIQSSVSGGQPGIIEIP